MKIYCTIGRSPARQRELKNILTLIGRTKTSAIGWHLFFDFVTLTRRRIVVCLKTNARLWHFFFFFLLVVSVAFWDTYVAQSGTNK